jgi:glycosyltransferase involved in cell wall biosynthesis
MSKQRVLVITGDPIGKKIAGPAIRAWNMAEQLSVSHDVTLLSFTSAEDIEAPFKVVCVPAHDQETFSGYENSADVIIFQGHAMLVFEALQTTRKIVVVDIYDPMHLEQLEQARELSFSQWEQQVNDATAVLNSQLQRGDFFVCASERQRIFWLGQLAALGRLNPLNYQQDPDLTGLVSVAPFGLSRTPPQHSQQVLKGVYPGIAATDKVILWSGGLYNWFDPHTLIQAVGLLSKKHPEIRLFFLGTKHPHPGVPEMEIVQSSKKLSKEIGVLDKNVFFNDSWVDFDDRQNYLLEADLGVSTHHAHIETMFSFRTRILDYLWATLPMVVTEGDHFGDLVGVEKLGISVEANNAQVLADALEKMLFDEKERKSAIKNISRVREDYFWDVALKPLTEFVSHAGFAPDHQDIPTKGFAPLAVATPRYSRNPLALKFRAVKSAYSSGGIQNVRRKLWKKIKG